MCKVYVFATLFAKAGRAQELFEALAGIVPLVRKENGCIRYDLHRSMDGQSFHFYEVWSDEKALDAHLAAEHMQDLRSRTEGMVDREAIVTKCESVDVACG